MKTFFVEQADKINTLKSIFNKVTKENEKIIINTKINKAKFGTKVKVAKKISNILESEKCRQIVVSKELKQDKELMNLLYGYNLNICSPKWLFKEHTDEVIESVLKDKSKEESEIWICINEIDDISQKYIYKFAKEFKRINIITNHIGKFKKIENKLYEEEGILINISNNKRKSLSTAELILNIDFPKEILNKFTIYQNATIITWEEDLKINKKRFNGTIIYEENYSPKYPTELEKIITENNLEKYDKRDICQAIEIKL